MKLGIKMFLGTAGGALSYYLGGWDLMLQVLVTVTLLDYITGLLAAAYEGKLSSKVGYKGIIKKVMMFCIIVLAYNIDQALGSDLVRNITITFYIGNEGLSIVENALRTDIKIPEKIKIILKQLLEKKDGDK